MHEEYYGFTEKPFTLTPDPRYLYRSPSHARALDRLHYAIARREGFIVITGDIGTGKTTLCRALLDQVDRTTFTALVVNPFVSEEDLLRVILQEFGVISRDESRRGRLGAVNKQELIQALNDFLLSLQPLGASALLIIDEAQNLPIQVLEQIRILSNLETDTAKLLQIVLVGQLNLQDVLRSPGLRQLDQRISLRCELQPLDRGETAAYIAHRRAVAGGGAVTFSPQALDRVHSATGGVPRLINLVCDRALLGGFTARTADITPAIVDDAAAELDLVAPAAPPLTFTWGRAGAIAVAAAAVILLIAGLYLGGLMQDGRAEADTLTPPEPAAASVTPPTSAPAAVASAPVEDPSSSHSVLVASFRQPGEADKLISQLAEAGFQARQRRVQQSRRGVWHQVVAGPYTTLEAAREAEARIKQMPGYRDAHLISQ